MQTHFVRVPQLRESPRPSRDEPPPLTSLDYLDEGIGIVRDHLAAVQEQLPFMNEAERSAALERLASCRERLDELADALKNHHPNQARVRGLL